MRSENPLKILVLTHEYPPVGGGGAQVIQSLCEGMASKNYRFHILTAHWGDLSSIEKKSFLTIERVKSSRKETFRAGLFTMACFVWKSFWKSLKIVRNWKPDFIHAHFAVPAGAAAAMAGILTNTPYIVTAHGGDVPGGAPQKTSAWFRFLLPFTRFIWRNAAKIVAVSRQSKELALKHYPVNIDVIPNGIQTEILQPEKIQAGNPPHIMYIGRFSPEKNAVMVPEILSLVKELPWRCTMLGDGLQMEEVRQGIKDHGITDRIDLKGWISPDMVVEELKTCDILLMPSFREGMPMTGLQALAAGAALVMTDTGACREMVDHGKNGYLIQAGSEDGYANALRKLLISKKVLINFKNHSMLKAKDFDLSVVLESYKNLYQYVAQEIS